MMTKKIFFTTAIFISALYFGQQSCHKEFQKTEEIAKKENKKILLYFSGSDWCKPCIMLKNKVLNNENFKKSIQEKFMIFQIDFPQNQKEISSKEIKCRENMAKKFNPDGIFPKLVLLDENKNILNEINGYMRESPEKILKQLEK